MPSIINATTTSGLTTSADNSGSLQLATNNGTTAVTIDTSQNVGIGTSSPTEKLHVAGSIFTTSNSNDFAKQGAQFDYITGGGQGWARINGYHSGGGSVYFFTNPASGSPTERMRITSGGDLLVNTTTSYAKTTLAGNNSSVPLACWNAGGTSGFFTVISFRNNAGTSEIGNVLRTNDNTISFNNTSDYRLKENIAPMTGALAKVAQLKPCTYTWKSDGSVGEGFIAHELAEVCPIAVAGEKDAVNEDGSIKPQGIDTSFLVATLTAAIQELSASVDALNAKVEAQAAEIAALKNPPQPVTE